MTPTLWRAMARMIFCVGDALIWLGDRCQRRAARAERRS